MKIYSHNLSLLFKKLETPIGEHLEHALKQGLVGKKYIPQSRKSKKESVEKYAARLFNDATKYQFIETTHNGENNFVAFSVSGPIITKQGKFICTPAQVINGRWGIHHVLAYPDIQSVLLQEKIFIRLDSGCVSGQLFGDTTCDCKHQYELAMKLCVENGSGIIINIPGHDGRGWAEYKMANQQLMDELNIDTVSAAKLFYKDQNSLDQRTYTEALLILKALGFNENHKFELATNSPRKVGAFVSHGLKLVNTKQLISPNLNIIAQKNLLAKSKEWDHTIAGSKL